MYEINNIYQLKDFIKSDLYRYGGKLGFKQFLISYFKIPGFRYSFWMRCSKYGYNSNAKVITTYSRVRLRHYSFKYGIQIPYNTDIGKGFYIGHFGEIIVSDKAKIGKNVNISQGVTIGIGGRVEKRGYPIIGDNVYIGPGAKIFGKIEIGNNVAIGANAVITKNIPHSSVVVGIPGKVISQNGSGDFVNNVTI